MQGRYDARKHYGKTQHFKQKEKMGWEAVIHMGEMVPSGKMGTVSFSSLALGRGM